MWKLWCNTIQPWPTGTAMCVTRHHLSLPASLTVVYFISFTLLLLLDTFSDPDLVASPAVFVTLAPVSPCCPVMLICDTEREGEVIYIYGTVLWFKNLESDDIFCIVLMQWSLTWLPHGYPRQEQVFIFWRVSWLFQLLPDIFMTYWKEQISPHVFR